MFIVLTPIGKSMPRSGIFLSATKLGLKIELSKFLKKKFFNQWGYLFTLHSPRNRYFPKGRNYFGESGPTNRDYRLNL